ncbi:MAG: hypothetical protein R3C19_20235 [Planctomycetaceae bacterium]
MVVRNTVFLRLCVLLPVIAAAVLLPLSTVNGQETSRVAAAGELTDRADTADDAKANAAKDGATVSPFAVVVDPERITAFDYTMSISGQLLTPTESGLQKWKLESSGDFGFLQRQRNTELSGPLSLDAVRRFSDAEVVMNVGDEHRTVTQLPASLQTIRCTGADTGIVYTSASSTRGRNMPLTRKHLDLLQMPGDPLVCSGLMPTGDVKEGEKWNTGSWVMPLLTGLEAVIEQSVTCEMESLKDDTASVTFEGSASGAVVGSASKINVSGKLTFDRRTGLITSYAATHVEERSAGPISPGLQVTVDVNWTQRVAESPADEPSADETPADTELAADFGDSEPTPAELSLQIQTPWKLQFQHSREWHVFNQTSTLLLLRQIRNGNLIAQCNLSPGVSVAPGQAADDRQFATDVSQALSSRDGQIVDQSTVRDDAAWRIRQVRAIGKASDQTINYDYYLCSAKTGEQFSFVFSYSDADAEAFGDEGSRILETLALLRRRPALPFR